MIRIFKINECNNAASSALFLLRVIFGLFMMTHGYDKLSHFDKIVQDFPDPLHISNRLSLMATIFAELICSGFVVMGFLTRLLTIPLAFCMAMATVVINGGKPLLQHELAPLYLSVFIAILIAGPGRISIDNLLFKNTSVNPIN